MQITFPCVSCPSTGLILTIFAWLSDRQNIYSVKTPRSKRGEGDMSGRSTDRGSFQKNFVQTRVHLSFLSSQLLFFAYALLFVGPLSCTNLR